MICSFTPCTKSATCRGWCSMHYMRWRRHGAPEITRAHFRGVRPGSRGIRLGMQGKTTQRATLMPMVHDLAWAAGFLEGEGSFHRSCTGSNTVSAVQVNKEPVTRLLALFGGSLRQYQKVQKNRQPYWRWAVCGARGRGVALTLYSLMSTKRQEQIRNAL